MNFLIFCIQAQTADFPQLMFAIIASLPHRNSHRLMPRSMIASSAESRSREASMYWNLVRVLIARTWMEPEVPNPVYDPKLWWASWKFTGDYCGGKYASSPNKAKITHGLARQYTPQLENAEHQGVQFQECRRKSIGYPNESGKKY
jgi:hypothetical protein